MHFIMVHKHTIAIGSHSHFKVNYLLSSDRNQSDQKLFELYPDRQNHKLLN